MKKTAILLFLFIFFIGLKAFSNSVFSHQVTAQTAAANIPVFDNTSCKFVQDKFLKASSSSLKSSGNFKFIKGNGVIFETTSPVYSVASYTSGKNNVVNAIIQSISTKNYTYIEKNFDIYYIKSAQIWTLALKPKSSSAIKSEMDNIQILGSTKNEKGIIDKIIIDGMSIKTTLNFTNCG